MDIQKELQQLYKLAINKPEKVEAAIWELFIRVTRAKKYERDDN